MVLLGYEMVHAIRPYLYPASRSWLASSLKDGGHCEMETIYEIDTWMSDEDKIRR